MQKTLTDRGLKALKPAPRGQRYEITDRIMPGLGVRVTDKGRRTFVFVARYPGSSNPTRRSLGIYPGLTLEEARIKAGEWRELIGQGIDPADEERRQREERASDRENTFGVVVEEYLSRHVGRQRKAADVEREIRRELIPAWGRKPITEVTGRDVVTLVERIADRPAPYQAHNIFGHVRTFFNWAIARGIYGIKASPCDRLKPAALIGAKRPRQRVLGDDELRSFWRASGRMGFPFGSLFRLLVLTGARKSEVSEARWGEFDLENRLWRIPPARFKSDATHLVPLTDQALAILRKLSRFKGTDLVFTTGRRRDKGEEPRPVSGFSKAKRRLDARMERTLKALARTRGEDPASVTLESFVIHDVRRTVRTRLSSLRVTDTVAEMVIGHGRRGLQRVYDQHKYEPEMREALELWTMRLRDIVEPAPEEPTPENVVELRHDVG